MTRYATFDADRRPGDNGRMSEKHFYEIEGVDEIDPALR
jgi:hypothetical protein